MKILFACLVCTTILFAESPTTATLSHHVVRVVAPAYPWLARKGRMQGETTTELRVGADGLVKTTNVTMAHPIFRDYVQSALKQWIFESDSQPFTQIVTVRFVLEDCHDVHSTNPDAYKETTVSADLPRLLEVKSCADIMVTTTD